MEAFQQPTPGADAAVIQMRDLAVGGGRPPASIAVEGIDWSIQTGDYWVVAGPRNSGKSDLLATMAGMQRPLRGTLRLFGVDRMNCHETELTAARLRIGIVFENGGRLFTHLSLAENVALPLCYHRNATPRDVRERIDELLEFGGLAALSDALPGRIGFPWRQRLALVRALAMRPEVLLLDDPLSGLGRQEVRWWRYAIGRLAAGHPVLGGQPATIVVGCHDLRPWFDQGKQFALLRERRWVAMGDRAQLVRAEDPLLHDLLATEFSSN